MASLAAPDVHGALRSMSMAAAGFSFCCSMKASISAATLMFGIAFQDPPQGVDRLRQLPGLIEGHDFVQLVVDADEILRIVGRRIALLLRRARDVAETHQLRVLGRDRRCA